MSLLTCVVIKTGGRVALLDSQGNPDPNNIVNIGLGAVLEVLLADLVPPVQGNPTHVRVDARIRIVNNPDPSGGNGQWGEVEESMEVVAT